MNATGNIARADTIPCPIFGPNGRIRLKTIHMLAAATLLATIGLASAADARPMDHHRHCTTQIVHHHKVTRCH